MAGSTWKGAIARRCVASEARPPSEDMSGRAQRAIPPTRPKSARQRSDGAGVPNAGKLARKMQPPRVGGVSGQRSILRDNAAAAMLDNLRYFQ